MNARLPSGERALEAQMLDATRGLRLAAVQLAAGVLAGVHRSRQAASSREFSQYRAYQPGDELRHLDWKLYARSDRLYLREGDTDSAIRLQLVLDATESMCHADTAGPRAGIRKFDAARLLAAAFAYLAQTQGDVFGLHAVSAHRVISLPPAPRRQPFERAIYALAKLEPVGSWPRGRSEVTAAVLGGVRSRESSPGALRQLTIILTDGYEHGREIQDLLAALRALQHEVVFFHLLGGDEITFPFTGPVRFEEWETGATFETDASSARSLWLMNLERHVREWRRGWGERRFDYAQIRTDEPLDGALRTYLLRRMKR